jgi:hypothetical protein
MEKLACIILSLAAIGITLYYSIDWDEERLGKHKPISSYLLPHFDEKEQLANLDDEDRQLKKNSEDELE